MLEGGGVEPAALIGHVDDELTVGCHALEMHVVVGRAGVLDHVLEGFLGCERYVLRFSGKAVLGRKLDDLMPCPSERFLSARKVNDETPYGIR